MSFEQEVRGKEVLSGLARRLSPEVSLMFGACSEGEYPVQVSRGAKAATILISEDDLADLAAHGGGGRKADMIRRLRTALTALF